MSRAAGLLAPLALIAALLAGWETACRLLDIPSYILPTPSAVAVAAVSDSATLLSGAWNTLSMALLALAVAAVAALSLAAVTALSRTLERAVLPLTVVLQVTPVVAIAPLVAIWAGVDHPQRAVVALAAVVAFFPIFSGAVTGMRAADPDLARLFDLYGADRLQRLVRLQAPSALPFVLEGVKVAAGLALIGAVVAEFVAGSGATQGLAWRILEAGARLQTARMFAALLVLGLMGAATHAVFQAAERRMLHLWRGR